MATPWGGARLSIHRAAATGFARSAAAYERGRPSYPDEAVDALVAALPGSAAEAIPLPDASADGVTVAQAFHWFDGERALAEIHRVLRPGGVLALIWNRRDTGDELQSHLTDLLERHRGDTPAHREQRWRDAFADSPYFGPLREQTFVNAQRLDASPTGRARSASSRRCPTRSGRRCSTRSARSRAAGS